MSRYGYWGFFKPAPTVGERKEKAAKTIARLSKKGRTLSPVRIEGRAIARTFWGKAWCDNIERYRDYAYRLERGRSYVRSGAVVDLRLSGGRADALVVGSGSRPYEISVRIDPMAKRDWDALVKRSAGRIASLMALAQGRLPEEMLHDFCDPETGLFPKPREIRFSCSCPDGASCCKHVAAVLYGIGARLDASPELFFTLRGIDPDAIVSTEVVDTLTSGAESELDAADLGDVFGIALDDAPAPDDTPTPSAAPAPDTAPVPPAAPAARSPRPKSARPSGKRPRPIASSKTRASSKTPSSPKPPASPKSPASPGSSDFPARLKALRARLGLSQAALGARLGTHQVAISLLERGKTAPGPDILDALLELERS